MVRIITESGIPSGSLPPGVRSRVLDNGNGLSIHLLEAGADAVRRPLVILLHGFPELGFSWRHVLPALAEAGFWVVAPDQRGYGWTTGWDPRFDGDPKSFWMLNLVEDVVGLTRALGVKSVATIVGHDFGAPVAAWCALTRPEMFRSVALMSAPFAGPPRPLTDLDGSPMQSMQRDLARLSPPRKHYHLYYSTPRAEADLRQASQGVHGFLRAYYHVKSADWQGNRPYPLAGWNAKELAKLPTYYVMNIHEGMAETVAPHAPDQSQVESCRWLPDQELRIYSDAFARTGFQGGLLWYRGANEPECIARLAQYAGQRISVPACFIAGSSDWGTYQVPGALESMTSTSCARFQGAHLVDGAGHWVQQEQSERVNALLLRFMANYASLA
jgi:pimeloyl-ACP methyl ester carboxylesterase